MISFLSYLGRSILFLLIEWLLIARLEPGPGWAPILYPMFFFSLPVQFSAAPRMLLGFSFGLILDLGLGTGGLHAAATTAMAFVQPFILRYFLSVDERENNLKPSPKSLGWLRYLWMAFWLLLVHQFFFQLYSLFTLGAPGLLLFRWIGNTFLSLLLIGLVQGLFYKKKA
jgi:hypothetical protein